MLVGFFFDWFLIFCLGAIWAMTLSRREGAPVLVRAWAWVVGGLYFLCWAASAKGMADALNAPPPVLGQVNEAPPGAALIENARLGVQLVVSAGLVWLVVLTVQTFTAAPPEEGEPPATDAA